MFAVFIMVAAFLCDIEGVSKVLVPTLYLAQQMSPFLTVLFIGVIILGIYLCSTGHVHLCGNLCKGKDEAVYDDLHWNRNLCYHRNYADSI